MKVAIILQIIYMVMFILVLVKSVGEDPIYIGFIGFLGTIISVPRLFVLILEGVK